jgi:hypothetical protein
LEVKLLLFLLFFELFFLEEDNLVPFVFGEIRGEGLLIGWQIGRSLVSQLKS